MDVSFGRLMAEVDQLKLSDNLFTLFTSDNGPARTSFHPHGETGSLREKKGWLYEGGIRVPGILRWPENTRQGSTSDIPVSGIDLLPTLCEVAGIPEPTDRAIDGTSFLPLLAGQAHPAKNAVVLAFLRDYRKTESGHAHGENGKSLPTWTLREFPRELT